MSLFNELQDGIINNWKTIMTIVSTIAILWVVSHIFGDAKRYYTENYNVSESFCDKDSTLPHLRPDALG
jgi:hypothetical protein|uniref:Uncharacterized protein n=1 Tax=viral metagenome TaxID=1070528 RepID=A0A6C0IP90_9ZZZZ